MKNNSIKYNKKEKEKAQAELNELPRKDVLLITEKELKKFKKYDNQNWEQYSEARMRMHARLINALSDNNYKIINNDIPYAGTYTYARYPDYDPDQEHMIVEFEEYNITAYIVMFIDLKYNAADKNNTKTKEFSICDLVCSNDFEKVRKLCERYTQYLLLLNQS